MTITPDLIVALTVDTERFRKAIQQTIASVNRFCEQFPWLVTMPTPPERAGLTARQYRAARRRYGRELRAWRKTLG